MNLEGAGRIILSIGVGLIVLGGLLVLLSKLGVSRLPGDVVFRRGPVTVYLPLGLSILLSIIATILLNIFLRR